MDYVHTSKEERRRLLGLPYAERLEATKECIRQVLAIAEYPLIQFSGGADSCVMADIIHRINAKVPCVFNDWGLFLPEQQEFCERFFSMYGYNSYQAKSGVQWQEFLPKNGFPLFKGVKFIPENRYKEFNISKKCRNLKDKCWVNLRKEYPVDYYFVGMLADESPQRKSLFINNGFVIPKSDKTILVKPIILLTKQEVFSYLRDNGIMYPSSYYQDTYKGQIFNYNHCDLGCFMCGIRLDKFGYGRLGRLARNRPDLWFKLLDLGLRDTLHKIVTAYPLQAQYISEMLAEYDSDKKTAYDLDGVLCSMPHREKSFRTQNKAERDSYEQRKIEWFSQTPCLWNPQRPFTIISGRREKYWTETEAWIQKHGLKCTEMHMMTGSLTYENILNHKVKYIKELGIERFFEDDPKLVRGIRNKCPLVQVVLVPRDASSVKILK